MSNEQEISEQLRKRAIDEYNAERIKNGWKPVDLTVSGVTPAAITALAKQLKIIDELRAQLAQQEPDKPEDPFLVKARELAGKYYRALGNLLTASALERGELDDGLRVQSFLEALKTGAAMTPQRRVTFKQIREMVKEAEPVFLLATDFDDEHADEANAFVAKMTDLINAQLAQGGEG